MALGTTTRSLLLALGVVHLSIRLEAFLVCPGTPLRCQGIASSKVGLARRTASAVCNPVRIGVSPLGLSSTPEDITALELNGREFQLEELEDKDECVTSVVLNEDGTVTAGETDGPLPNSSSGAWTLDGETFKMTISRDYESSYPYTVTRKFSGVVDEVLPATDTLILSGDIELDDMKVGYFKMISAPSDITDSVSHLDEKVKELHA